MIDTITCIMLKCNVYIFVRKANIFDLKLLNFIQTFEYHKHFQNPTNIDIYSAFTIYSVLEKNLHI